jgi:chromosomal replication initiation ATPase DnaA
MPEVILLPRNPKGSEMTLSNQVKQSIDEATANLREALAFAARTEHPVTISTLTDILVRLESLESIEEIMHKFGKQHDIPTNFG